ncbi:MAG: T9SS type A sorting domain-containing protein, partial [Bacteroidota bacterium]|nr:T9SS type A sorting domain-containing protein [Bacteroidota bacterium]
TPPVTSGNTAYALEDVKMINVFPNPYYGVNPQEINKYQRFVTFSHLPQTATIRIFNVAGQLVRTIARDNSASQFERWDLNNENGLPVGSGMYIAHIDMGPLGSKILKLAVIQEQQVLDRF